MKLLFATVLVALFGQSSVLLAQSAASDTDTIIRLEREWEAAILKKDQATIDRIVALDCVFVASNGELMTKAQADAERKETTYGTSKILDIQVRIFGDVAVVVGSNQESSVNRLNVTTGAYRWTDVFVKRGGTWQVISAQSTKID